MDSRTEPRWLVHIGGGPSSVATLERARAHGLCTLVFDREPRAPGARHATRLITRDPSDPESLRRAVHELAADHALAGCATASDEPDAIRLAAQLRADHDLPGPRPAGVESLLDRSAWKKLMIDAGIETPASAVLTGPEELDAFLDAHPCCLLAPESGGHGTLGVSRVRVGEPRCRELYDDARLVSSSDLVRAEAFVAGDAYTVDGWVREGRFELLHLGRLFSARNLRGALPTGHAWGALQAGDHGRNDPLWRRAADLGRRVAIALGLDDSFLGLELLDDGETLHVIAIAPRLGDGVDRGLDFAGVDVAALACALATGEAWQVSIEPGAFRRGYALRRFYPEVAGVFRRMAGPLAWWDIDGGVRVEIDWRKPSGIEVERPRSPEDRLAFALVEASDQNTAWRYANGIDPSSLFELVEPETEQVTISEVWSAPHFRP